MVAAYKMYHGSKQQKPYYCISKRTYLTSNCQFFVENLFPTISEPSKFKIIAYMLRINPTGSNLQNSKDSSYLSKTIKLLMYLQR